MNNVLNSLRFVFIGNQTFTTFQIFGDLDCSIALMNLKHKKFKQLLKVFFNHYQYYFRNKAGREITRTLY